LVKSVNDISVGTLREGFLRIQRSIFSYYLKVKVLISWVLKWYKKEKNRNPYNGLLW